MLAGEANRQLEVVARKRFAEAQAQIRKTQQHVREGNPLAAEWNPQRLMARLETKNQLTHVEAEAAAVGIQAIADMSEKERASFIKRSAAKGGPEAIWGDTIDFVGVAFLERGRRTAQAVGRVAFKNGAAQGTGFMVSERLFITNNHVIPSRQAAAEMCVQFDYEYDMRDKLIGETSFAFDPGVCITNRVSDLDFTLIGIGERIGRGRDLAAYGFSPLSDASDKHALGEFVNVVQHPQGRYKEVVLRENRLAARGDFALHYYADTEPGSSGSPVFNNQWQAVALHHWGAPYRMSPGEPSGHGPRSVNEGIRISAIVKWLRQRVLALRGQERDEVETALRLWDSSPSESVLPGSAPDSLYGDHLGTVVGPRLNHDGSTSWFFPLEIMVRAPLATPSLTSVAAAALPAVTPNAERALRPSTDFADRGGYEPGFIPGHVVPLPKLNDNDNQEHIAARNLQPQAGDDPFELRYHHFSAVVNGERKLAFFTACNIDGKKSKYINRNDGTVTSLDPSNADHGLMERLAQEGGSEASEAWYEDDRLALGQVAIQDTYEGQVVPGHLDTRSMGRTLRMFQRGHLVRRLDPAWGTNSQARLAEADTFFFTNCAPQVGFFNMGRASWNQPGTGGGKLWRAVENLVLRNARNERSRVCSFTGPIFTNEDRPYRNIHVPGRFFKIAVWAESGTLRSLGMIADQRPVIHVWPEALFHVDGGEAIGETIRKLGAEAFQDEDELERVEDFLTTIARIESVTGLDFGAAVRNADIRAGESIDYRPETLGDVPLNPAGANARRSASRRKRGQSRRGK